MRRKYSGIGIAPCDIGLLIQTTVHDALIHLPTEIVYIILSFL